MSVTRDVTRDVPLKNAVTFAVSHNYPSRPDPTRPTSSSYVSHSVDHPYPKRLVSDGPIPERWGWGC